MKRIIRLTESDLTRIVRRIISEQDATITPNHEYFKQNPKGILVIDDMGSYLTSINGINIEEGQHGMNSDEVIPGGQYEYTYPVNINRRISVQLFQNGQKKGWFYPKD